MPCPELLYCPKSPPLPQKLVYNDVLYNYMAMSFSLMHGHTSPWTWAHTHAGIPHTSTLMHIPYHINL